jgi:hypothetical protein
MDKRGFKFGLGDKVQDKVTGFQGVVTSRGDHISGCDTYGVQPVALKDGAPADVKWLDEPRMKLVQAQALAPVDTREDRTGADSVPQETRSNPR